MSIFWCGVNVIGVKTGMRTKPSFVINIVDVLGDGATIRRKSETGRHVVVSTLT